MENLTILDAIERIRRAHERLEAIDRQTLEADAHRPHDFAVADDDRRRDAVARERAEDAIDAQAELRDRLTSPGRNPVEAALLAHLQILLEASGALCLWDTVEVPVLTLAKEWLETPADIEPEMPRRLACTGVRRCECAIECRPDVRADPRARSLRL